MRMAPRGRAAARTTAAFFESCCCPFCFGSSAGLLPEQPIYDAVDPLLGGKRAGEAHRALLPRARRPLVDP